MLEPVEVQRDPQGYWVHPKLADSQDELSIADHPEAEGLHFAVVVLEEGDGEVADAYFERGEVDISAWHPGVPDGVGWFVVAICDTEDGPCCIYARSEQTESSTCIGCGCTDVRACQGASGPCHWLRVDRRIGRGVCSECAEHVARWDAGERTSGAMGGREGAQ